MSLVYGYHCVLFGRGNGPEGDYLHGAAIYYCKFVRLRKIDKEAVTSFFQSHRLDVIVLQGDGSFLFASVRINGGELRCRHVDVLTAGDDVNHIVRRVVANGIGTWYQRYDAFHFISRSVQQLRHALAAISNQDCGGTRPDQNAMGRFEAFDGLQMLTAIEVEYLDCTVILSSEEQATAGLVYGEMIEIAGVSWELHASF